ncbi:MAG: GntR family transcriptional regulator [Fusobacterium sp. JB021]|nr:GntR family transcriptional regulator [Fusobacterium sp. JB020]MDP0492758.1 GntR family transcriptional regulator [Fusobacterium sp. JB021]MDP0507075.1 GntR family transcriptional regulator [Fusobacterium sp. JB019]
MEKNEKSYEILINFVKDNIKSGHYKLGDKLPPERQLAESLNISRNSVREGIRILNRMGALKVIQGSGNYIHNNFLKPLEELIILMASLEGHSSLKEIIDFRYALELEALTLTINKITPSQLKEISIFLNMLKNCQTEEMKSFYDKKLHFYIAELSENRYIIDNLKAFDTLLNTFIENIRAKIFTDEENKEKLFKSHEEIVEGLYEKNLEKSRKALNKHFEYIYKYMTK